MPLDDISTAEEAAEYLRLTPDKLKRMARAKQIGHIKNGRSYLFTRDAIEKFVQENTVEPLPTITNPYGLTDRGWQRLLRQKRD